MSTYIRSAQYVIAIIYLLIFYYLLQSYWPHVSTPSTDTLVFILTLLILVSSIDVKAEPALVFPITILAIYSVTVKLSAAPVLLLASYVMLTKSYWHQKRQVLITATISSFILVPWLIRNVLLTGWLIFPFPTIDLFSFDWQLPLHEVISRKEAIKLYYTSSTSVINGSGQAWVIRQSGADLLVIITSLLALISLIFCVLTKKITLSADWTAGIIVALVGIGFMFSNSPSLRYGAAFFLAFTLVAIHLVAAKNTGNRYIFYGLSFFVMGSFLIKNWFHPWHFVKVVADRFLLPYPLVLPQNKEFAYFLIDKKIKCYYPIQSDQCFDQTLPCAYRKIERVHLRGKDIDQGFYSDAP